MRSRNDYRSFCPGIRQRVLRKLYAPPHVFPGKLKLRLPGVEYRGHRALIQRVRFSRFEILSVSCKVDVACSSYKDYSPRDVDHICDGHSSLLIENPIHGSIVISEYGILES